MTTPDTQPEPQRRLLADTFDVQDQLAALVAAMLHVAREVTVVTDRRIAGLRAAKHVIDAMIEIEFAAGQLDWTADEEALG